MKPARAMEPGQVLESAVDRVAALRAEGQTVYWLAASGRDLSALLQGIVREGLREQAIQNLHRDPWESTELYAARRAQEDDGG
jgi:hypothetical protein